MERWIWWTVWLGFVTMIYHRLDDTLGWFHVGRATALLISIIALVAAVQTKLLLKKRELAKAKLIKIQEEVAALNPRSTGMAEKLAEIFVGLKEQLQYYEAQAKDVGIPPYKRDGKD